MEKIYTILIIEDEFNVGDLLCEAFRTAGYQAIVASDGMMGVQLVHEHKPDLVVLDLMLPGVGGLSVLERFKTSRHTQGIPVVIVTGLRDEDIRQQAIRAGAIGFFEKPVSLEELLRQVKQVLQKSGLDGGANWTNQHC